MDIEAKLKKYIMNELLNSNIDIDLNDNLLADGMVDSLAMVRLVSHIEDWLMIKIPHSDLVIENFRSIEVIAKYLRKRQKQEMN